MIKYIKEGIDFKIIGSDTTHETTDLEYDFHYVDNNHNIKIVHGNVQINMYYKMLNDFRLHDFMDGKVNIPKKITGKLIFDIPIVEITEYDTMLSTKPFPDVHRLFFNRHREDIIKLLNDIDVDNILFGTDFVAFSDGTWK